MVFLFWMTVGLIFLTYPGYVLFLMAANLLFKKPIDKKDADNLSVSMIIAAYNEEEVIEEKILNTLVLDYDKDNLEILVVSDGSTDRTEEIVEKYASKGVKLITVQNRGGKTAAQNECIKHASGEIFVFSDADIMYGRDAVKKLVRNFNDPTVGCVGGRLLYGSKDTIELVKEKKLYSSFDQFIKKMESNIRTCIGVDGAMYAIRKQLVRPLPDTLTSDFFGPLDVISKGFRVVFEEKAVAHAEIASSSKMEFKRKIRTVRAGVTVLHSARRMLNPLEFGRVSFILIFHKLLRWIFFIFLALLLFSSYYVKHDGWFYFLTFYSQVLFYGFALTGFFIKKRNPKKIFTVPFYFCMYNLCAAIGILKFIFGKRSEQWEIER
ncbi:MAG: glycosyltransferase family 2 protein [Desulfobacterales bacterium]|nr:glycosyltransferase family 2 protein [Desulfobacterales bacterium]